MSSSLRRSLWSFRTLFVETWQQRNTSTVKTCKLHDKLYGLHTKQANLYRCFSSHKERPVVTTTIDEEELRKFTKLSQLWWDEQGDFQALHTMNSVRVPLIKDALVSPPISNQGLPLEGLNIVDVGCGGGILTEPLARLGAFCVGIDMVEENINIAQAHLKDDPNIQSRIKYIQVG